ncbi:MAG TPA: helix-turn-helix domain-containing protein [Lentisphaeria bacterium]|nr:helix-turn-helix domain-containing protein [Lentisphaeria bacterium]
MPRSDMVQSVLKALDILRLAASSPRGMRLNEIAEALGMKTSTAHNLIRTLCARGFLSKDSANRFHSGNAIHELSSLSSRNQVMVKAAALLRQLYDDYPLATITFSELTTGAIRCRLRMSSDRPGELQQPMDYVFQPYVSPTAVCLQATAVNAPEYEQLFPFADFGAATWGTSEAFTQEKDLVRQQSYAIRRKNNATAIAFAVPEKYVLGLSLEIEQENLDALIAAAKRKIRDFRAALA